MGRGTLDAQTCALLDTYDEMKLGWTERVAKEGISASRDFADAVFDRFRGAERDVMTTQTIDLMVPTDREDRPGRLYLPATPTDGRPPAIALFLHGGGWSLGSLAAYDGLVGSLAALSGVAMLSLDYSLAPEHRFPIALEQARSAIEWLATTGGDLGVDPTRLAVIGDSAGGNLAAGVAREAALKGGPDLACQVLIYPMTDVASPHEAFPSRQLFGDGRFFLMTEGIEFARDSYLGPNPEQAGDPRVSPLLGEIPKGLAPAFILTAGHDPLRDEAHDYHFRLRDAGIQSRYVCVDDMVHAFLSFGVLDQAQAGRRMIAAYLKALVSK